MRIVPSKRNVSLLSYFLALRCRIKVNAHLAGSLLSLRTVGRRPVALTSRFSCFVLVIHVAEYRDSRIVSVVETEETSQIAVFASPRRLHVGDVSTGVLTLQGHIHHIVFLLHLLPHESAFFRRTVIHLQFLYGIVRKIVEHHLILPLEEVFSVEEQIIYLFAVYVNIAVTLHFGSRHLSDKSVEHGAIRHIECAGVKDERIATVSQLHLGASHHHVIEGNILIEFLLEQKRRK